MFGLGPVEIIIVAAIMLVLVVAPIVAVLVIVSAVKSRDQLPPVCPKCGADLRRP